MGLDSGVQSCAHRWVLDGTHAVRCVICPAQRQMTDDEITRIEGAQRAGVIFLKWPSDEILNARRRDKRKSQSVEPGEKRVTVSTSQLAQGSEIPEGYITVQDYGVMMKLEPKKARKLARQGRLDALKVGGHVYVRRPA